MKRLLPLGTAVVLKQPYKADRLLLTQGRIREYIGLSSSGQERCGITFEGYRNEHGPITVDFSRDEFILAVSE